MIRKDFVKPDGRKLQLYSRRPISDEIIPTNPPHNPFSPNPQMRWHPLRNEWVIYAAHRQDRTFLPPKEYSPLMPTKNPEFPTELPAGDYDIAVFENLFPSMSNHASALEVSPVPTSAGRGSCEVVVFTQDPEATLGSLSVDRIQLVLEVIGDRTKELGQHPEINYVLPFENRGVEVGVTLHHPHGQIYSYPFVPPVVERMWNAQSDYFKKNNRTLLSKVLEDEVKDGSRVYVSEPSVKAFIPSFARYPYETWIVPDRPVPWLHDLSGKELKDLAIALKTVLVKFDTLWDRPFPYLMTIYQAPTDQKAHPEFHTHIQIYPAYRTKDKLKYLAGTEIGAGIFVNDSFPEEKAKELKNVQVPNFRSENV